MADSIIKSHDIKKVIYQKPITWSSTSNPYFSSEYDVTIEGYRAINAGYVVSGTFGTCVFFSAFYLDYRDSGKDYLCVNCRMVQNNPSSTTQNTLTMVVIYIKV